MASGDPPERAAIPREIPAGLSLVATPIGNLRDISLRALSTLSAADLILAEDTRVTKVLLAHYGITTPLMAYHEHNAAEMRPKIMERLARGQALALVSDAGTPLVSDPGFKFVREAAQMAASGTLDFSQKPPRFEIALDLKGVDVGSTPKSWHLAEAGLTGRLTGKIQLRDCYVLLKDGEAFLLNGEKLWCTNGTRAGVIVVMAVTFGMICPPVGMNVFVIKSVVKDVSFTTIFKGVLPFVATDIIRLIILITFPMIALWLPSRMG